MKHYLEEIIQTPLLGHDQYCNDTHTHTYIYIYIYIYIQSVPGGMCKTSGECSLC